MNGYEQVIADALYCARLFRLGRDIEAALKMVEVIDVAVGLSDSCSAEYQAQLVHIMGTILKCQERQDWIGVADWLEYELVELCQSAVVG